MYIISESLANNDPRLRPEVQRLYDHWEYTAYYIPDDITVTLPIDDIGACIVEEKIARAMKFCNVANGKVGFRRGTLAHEEIFGESTEPDGHKTYYYLNDEDFANVVEVYKAEMRLYLARHYNHRLSAAEMSLLQSKRQGILDQINDCETVDDCATLLHTRFGLDFSKDYEEKFGSATFDLSNPGKDNYS